MFQAVKFCGVYTVFMFLTFCGATLQTAFWGTETLTILSRAELGVATPLLSLFQYEIFPHAEKRNKIMFIFSKICFEDLKA